MRTTTIMAVAAGAVCSVASAQSFVNGNFETNDLSGWTVQNYASGAAGSMGVGAPGSVTSQDIDDTGPLGPSPAATFYVGLASFAQMSEGGIEMTQSLVLSAGVPYTVQFDWLAQRQAAFPNAEGGVFALVVDGTAVSTVSAGEVVFGAPKHGHFSASFTPSAGGAHTVGIRITRPYVQPGETSQHVDNVTISAGSTPCYANCDASTIAPILNVNDFTCFLNNFAAGLTSANCDGSTTAPTLNVNDFTCFLNLYAAGC